MFCDHSDEIAKATSNNYSIKASHLSSRYNGVSKSKRRFGAAKFEAKFAKYRLGSYVLEVDAALAYDGAVRGRQVKKYYSKINFATEQDYLDAREKELETRGITVDLEETLAYISKVKDAISKVTNDVSAS